MIIKKGTGVTVRHYRFGTFYGVAKRDFDTETEEFYPIVAAQPVIGMGTTWLPGEEVPCRDSLCSLSIHKKPGEYLHIIEEMEKRENKLKEMENKQ